MSERLAKKLLIIGWDAADWMIIDHLLAHGEMPNLKRLLEAGVRADMGTLEPRLSPMLWTTVATGKTADKHGILNFLEPDPLREGLRISSSTTRRTKALWNMLTQSGMRINVISWYASHPAEPINGACVSNLFQEGAAPAAGEPWPMVKAAVHPPDLAERIAQLRVHPAKLERAALRSLLPHLDRIDPKDARLGTLRRHMAQCVSVHNVATAIMEADTAWDCTMVFYDAIDAIGHHFMQYHPPRVAHVSQKDFELYRDVMLKLYQFHDVMLGRLLALAGPDVTTILLSDHGFYSDHLRPVTQDMSTHDRAAAEALWHRPIGVLAMSGPPIKPGQRIHGASLLDVTPTALALLGLPVGLDMDGRVLMEAFQTPAQVKTLFTWDQHRGEAGMHPPDLRQDPFEARDAIRQLVELGYMADLPEDAKAQVEVARRESRFNLAVVYMTTRRPDQAIPIFEELARQHPDEARFTLGRARCLFMCLRFDECAAALQKFLQRHPDNVEARMLRAGALATAGEDAGAAAELDRIEAGHAGAPELALPLGDVCSSLRRWEKAEHYYRRAAQADPTHPLVQLGLARAALGQRRLEDAVDCCLRAVELQHVFPEAHHLLGVTLTWMKDYAHAIQSFNIALSMQPGMLDSHRYLASIYRHLGRAEEAARHRVQAEKLIAAKASGQIAAEFLKREAPMGPQEWARHVGLGSDAAASPLGEKRA